LHSSTIYTNIADMKQDEITEIKSTQTIEGVKLMVTHDATETDIHVICEGIESYIAIPVGALDSLIAMLQKRKELMG
jgi:hypothetical protein